MHDIDCHPAKIIVTVVQLIARENDPSELDMWIDPIQFQSCVVFKPGARRPQAGACLVS